MDEGAAENFGRDRRSIEVQELVHPLQRDICWLPVDWRDMRVFESLDDLVHGGGRQGGGLTN